MMKKGVLIPVLILVILITAMLLFLNQEAPADGLNFQAMESDVLVTVSENSDAIIFEPATMKASRALVYYQGANVAPQSFAYAGRKIAEAGIQVFLVKMPFSLAIFDIGAAYPYPEKYPEIEHWALGGFSLGGSSAAFALANKESRYEALILYASYTDEKHSLRDKAIKVLSISGSNDGLATPQDIEKGKTLLPPDTQYLVIPGGNHTQFALYGNGNLQKGDNKASLSAMGQQQMVIDATVAFLLQGRQ
jgi:dienelactone hydrolase